MNFTIEWHPQAFKILEKLPLHVIARITKKLDKISEAPFRYLEHYEGEKVYKLRIGDYRALVDVDQINQVLLVQAFDHRGRIYKR